MILPVINVIHDTARLDRLDLMLKEMEMYGVDLRIHRAVKSTAPKIGIAMAHQNVIREAKNSGAPEVLVAEDDFHILGKGAFELFTLNKPDDYDLYLSSIYWGRIGADHTVKDFAGLTFYFCHSRFYDKFLSIEQKKDRSIDRAMKKLKGKYVVCHPFTVIQHETPSDNHFDGHGNRTIISNARWLKGRSLYVEKVF